MRSPTFPPWALASLLSPVEEVLIAAALGDPPDPPEWEEPEEGIFGGAYVVGDPGLGVVGFLGSKRRYAPRIVDEMEGRWGPAARWSHFYDACAGSGQVALEVRRRAPKLAITLVDVGPWGAFWAEYVQHPAAVERELVKLGAEPAGAVCSRLNGHRPAPGAKGAAQFLTMTRGTIYGRLPAGGDTYQGKPWRSTCLPASRGTRGVASVVEALQLLRSGPLRALHADAEAAPYKAGAVLYADPDYKSGAGHYRGNRCDPARLVTQAHRRGVRRIAISYPRALGVPAASVKVGARCSPAGKGTGTCQPERLLFPR